MASMVLLLVLSEPHYTLHSSLSSVASLKLLNTDKDPSNHKGHFSIPVASYVRAALYILIFIHRLYGRNEAKPSTRECCLAI